MAKMRLNAKKFLKKIRVAPVQIELPAIKKIVLSSRRKLKSRILNPGFRVIRNDGFQRFTRK
jgi:hypothetical protein